MSDVQMVLDIIHNVVTLLMWPFVEGGRRTRIGLRQGTDADMC